MGMALVPWSGVRGDLCQVVPPFLLDGEFRFSAATLPTGLLLLWHFCLYKCVNLTKSNVGGDRGLLPHSMNSPACNSSEVVDSCARTVG